jgi:hypothetical protein
MANLLGQNIGTNYKGILNLNTLNGNLSGTLQAVTDGDGNASPLQLSTTSVNFTEQVTLTKSGGVFAVGIAGFSRFVGFTADNDSALVYNASNGLRIATVANVSMGGFSERARFDSNGNFVLGTTTASARLHVRGDGTNPILRTEDNSGNAVGVIAYNTRLDIYGRNFSSNEYLVNIYNGLSWGATSGTVGFLNFSNTSFSAGAGSANFRPLNIAYTINNSGAQTGTATGIFLNATETALNGMTHNLMDLGATVSSTYTSRLKMSGGSLATLTVGDPSFQKGQINILTDSLNYFLRISGVTSGNNQSVFIGDGNGAWETQFNGTTTQYWDYQNNVTIGNRNAYGNRLSVVAKAANNAAVFYTSAIGEIATIGVGGGGTSRFLGAVRTDAINDYANGYTMLQYVSATQIRLGNDALRLNPTTLEAIFNGAIRAASLPTTRPATIGDLYQDTAANILANGDKVVGIRV